MFGNHSILPVLPSSTSNLGKSARETIPPLPTGQSHHRVFNERVSPVKWGGLLFSMVKRILKGIVYTVLAGHGSVYRSGFSDFR